MFRWIRKQSRSTRRLARKLIGAAAGGTVGVGTMISVEALGHQPPNGDPVELIAAGLALIVYDRVRNFLKDYIDPAVEISGSGGAGGAGGPGGAGTGGAGGEGGAGGSVANI